MVLTRGRKFGSLGAIFTVSDISFLFPVFPSYPTLRETIGGPLNDGEFDDSSGGRIERVSVQVNPEQRW